MKVWKLLPLALLVGCTSVDSGNSGLVAGSPAWFETAPPGDIVNYFRQQCVYEGYTPGTPEIAKCIQRQAHAHKQKDIAREAAVAAATAGF